MRRRILRFVLEVVFRPWSRRKQLDAGHLRCISGLVRTGKSDDDADLDWALRIAARATSAELESRVHLLELVQEMSEKNIGCVLLRRLLREPQQMHARFKLVTGSPRRDKQGPIKVGVIVGLSGAYQARNASQSPPFELFCNMTKVEKQLPTRTAKTDDALAKNNLVAYFSNRPIFGARSHQHPVSHI
jgi:hypothetical protein